ncbi:MAG: NADH-quinone oxidoreductase subunit C [Candidatus Thermoplasmatota archaeon]|jgi:NADH-quinone oxidoreductase subunit C|uniref:NADH-quinone oxidoreductase subunit C n=1 Tax=Candidatus Sysuiplasma superficiale TaxID=2823368 RepID=A0A8J7YLN7_9ARCH|nr:NADH-quinone oxidoreductase subunit C [Candidatus Sysuiplasma superficiale]MBX8632902.1 NADH-quinone oxidoreductase subunit C [Candidatus Sysuiplasma jiujiangense]MBX8640270.1 NADH-quinone oxidoreductase subunit C [Candidatus Sysuiplasma jiujiangense]MBX8641632.1 NADH-quinone oxidoreductase subunit C [Candidatus Sysuiplasma jiujiangense]MCL5253302.1 NADH-quinone oxidoreductase subunit C [Candidatus Thermoplasmatota archaeon]
MSTPTVVISGEDRDYSKLGISDVMPVQELITEMKSHFPDIAVNAKTDRRIEANKVPREKLLEFCTFLKEKLHFDHLTCMGGNDLRRSWEVFYHISSYRNRCIIQIRCELPRNDPSVDSLSLLWGGANWHERETYDMYGIVFNNHPKLERVLSPEGTDFFPFRKDFKLLDHWKIDWENKGKRPPPQPLVSSDPRKMGDADG